MIRYCFIVIYDFGDDSYWIFLFWWRCRLDLLWREVLWRLIVFRKGYVLFLDWIFGAVFVNIMLILQDIVSILVYNRYFWRRNEISLSIEMIKWNFSPLLNVNFLFLDRIGSFGIQIEKLWREGWLWWRRCSPVCWWRQHRMRKRVCRKRWPFGSRMRRSIIPILRVWWSNTVSVKISS